MSKAAQTTTLHSVTPSVSGPSDTHITEELSETDIRRALQAPGSTAGTTVLALQRKVGNQAVLRLLEHNRQATTRPRAPRVQRDTAPVVGAQGGPLDAQSSQEIRRARGGGKPIAEPLRAPVENALGADLSHARLHMSAQTDRLNERLGARAFTVGSDIFMKRSEFNPSSRQGKRLLYHEMTHVRQQTGGLQRAPLGDTVQRAWALVNAPTWSRQPQGALDTSDPKKALKQVAGGVKVQKYPKMYRLLLDDDATKHIKDQDGNVVWYRLKNWDAYLPAAKLLTGIAPSGRESSDPDMGGEDLESLIGALGDSASGVDDYLVEGQQWYAKLEESEKAKGEEGLSEADEAKSEQLNKAEASMWMTGSALGTVSGIMGMASALKDLRDDAKSAWERVDAVFEYLSSGMDTIGGLYGTAGSIAGAINIHAQKGSTVADDSEAVSGWGFGFQTMFGVLSNGIKAIKNGADLIHMIYTEIKGTETHDRDEYLNTISELLIGALDTARGVLVSIRQITQLVTDGIMSAFDNVIPGLDIASAAVDTIFKGYYLIESAVHHWWMRSRKKELLAKLQQEKGFNKDQIKEAQKFYRKQEAEKSNYSHEISKTQKSYDKTDKKIGKSNDWEKITKLGEKKRTLSDRKRTMTTKLAQTEQSMSSYESDPSHPQRKDIAEIELVSELKEANRKRIVRQSVHIASNALKIAGSITALLAGPGAPAGIGLKAAAAGIDVSLPVLRSLKQWGRNKAAHMRAQGKSGTTSKFFNKIFNADKSTAAKLAHRKKQAVMILLLIADLNRHIPVGKDPAKRKALASDIRNAERYIRAAGCSPARLYRANGKIGEQIKILVESLSKRELG